MTIADSIKIELCSLCPDFETRWDSERECWVSDDGSFTVHGVFSAFSQFIADCIARGPSTRLQPVFDWVESKLTGDGSEVENAACTCFLENLMNRVPEQIRADCFVPLLGPKSRQFCRLYDEWCGIKTDGL